MIAGRSSVTALRYAYWPMPGQAKIVSTSTVPVSTFAKIEPDHGHDRGQRGAEDVAARARSRSARPFARAART